MMAQKQKQADDALTPAELLERCAPACDKPRRGMIFAAALVSALCLAIYVYAYRPLGMNMKMSVTNSHIAVALDGFVKRRVQKPKSINAASSNARPFL